MSTTRQAAELFATLVSTAQALDEWDAEFSLPDHLHARYAEAARALASLGEATRPLLDDGLTRADARVRRQAVRALGRLGGHGSTDVLLAALAGDRDDEVRVASADALAACRDPRAVAALRLALRDGDAAVRRAGTAALVACDPDVACDLLDEAQLGDLMPFPVSLDETQLAHLAASLVSSSNPRAVQHLVRLACNASGGVRKEAFHALAPRLEGRPDLADELLRPCLSAPGVTDEAAAHIGLELALRGRPIAQEMIPLTRSTSHAAAVLSSRALVRGAGASGAHGIDVALIGPNAGARGLAIAELADPPPELAREGLRRLLALALSDADPRNVSSALEVVARLDLAGPLVGEIVAVMARRDAGDARFNRARALIETLGPVAAPPLVALLDHRDSDVRVRAAWLMAHGQPPEALAALRAALHDPVDAVRAAAERALARHADADVMKLLVQRHAQAERSLLDRVSRLDPKRDNHDLADECVLANAAKDVGRSRHPDAYAWLVELAERALAAPTNREGELTRGAHYRATGAIEGLGLLGDPRGAPWILRSLAHPDFRLRRNAADALSDLGDPSHEPALRAALRDANGQVRAAARRALASLARQRS